MLAWFEAATCAAVADQLRPDETSVGTAVELGHRAASAVGATVLVSAEVTGREGRAVRFAVTAVDDRGVVLGDGQVTRAVVVRDRFLARLTGG